MNPARRAEVELDVLLVSLWLDLPPEIEIVATLPGRWPDTLRLILGGDGLPGWCEGRDGEGRPLGMNLVYKRVEMPDRLHQLVEMKPR